MTVDLDGNADARDVLGPELKECSALHLRNVRTATDPRPFYSDLLSGLGTPVLQGEDASSGRFVSGEWLDIRYDPDRAESFRHSNTRQPLHTDGAYIDGFEYDFVVLVCARAADHGGSTHMIDANSLVDRLRNDAPGLLDELCHQQVVFSKGPMGSLQRCIIEQAGSDWLLNWNHFRVADTNAPSVLAMARAFHDFLEHRVVAGGLLSGVRLVPGEALFLRDRRLLHGREAFSGPRCLYKAALRL